jgi:hypothetical protein
MTYLIATNFRFPYDVKWSHIPFNCLRVVYSEV